MVNKEKTQNNIEDKESTKLMPSIVSFKPELPPPPLPPNAEEQTMSEIESECVSELNANLIDREEHGYASSTESVWGDEYNQEEDIDIGGAFISMMICMFTFFMSIFLLDYAGNLMESFYFTKGLRVAFVGVLSLIICVISGIDAYKKSGINPDKKTRGQ